MLVTACTDNLNANTVNVKSVSAMCVKCVMTDKHDVCVTKSVAKPLRKPVASESVKKPRNNNVSMPLGIASRTANVKDTMTSRRSTMSNTPLSSNTFAAHRDCPIHRNASRTANVIDTMTSRRFTVSNTPLSSILLQLVEIVLFIIDSGCSKHMKGNLKLLINFMEKFMGTVKFGNDQIVPILRYGDLVQGAVMINRVYYVEGLNHNLFSVGQFCDADLEVAFRKSTCFIGDLKGNDLLTGSCDTDLYLITLKVTNCPNPICLMAKATSSQAWLWHRRLSHLNFDTINLLSKNDIVVGLPKLKFIKDHLCSF
nr:integrase, catalytic region, zinc finger, CCHC-type, peptidase aspartic, catalytic [Tanacetum cinerariifolium]